MGLFDRLINKKEEASIAFVDYEYWFYSLQNQFGIKPDPKAWADSLDRIPTEIMVFGEFSGSKGIAEQITVLRTITNTIIETRQQNGIHKKDMTDFIMLDYIYQTSVKRKDISTYIIFTGDGHFQSVVKYLTSIGKKVVVYGVRGTFSSALQNVASETVIIPDEETTYREYTKMIVSYLDYTQTKISIIPTFNGTVSAVVKNNRNVSEELVKQTLQRLLDEGLITRKKSTVSADKKVQIIRPEWQKLHDAGFADNQSS